MSADAIAAAYREWSLPRNGPVGLFCGSLYPAKKLELLVAASDLIRARIPTFTLVVIGDGPSKPLLERAAGTRPWLRLVGVRQGAEKSVFFRLANVILNPGLVGLHVLDAFAAGVPLVTAANSLHSPEVAYLQHGVNGLLVGDTPAEFGGTVVALLEDPRRRAEMARAALASSRQYSLENMVQRFAQGIQACLEAPRRSVTALMTGR
jgi:glycosyltransferase involved in cell wall biosynthesis